MCFVPFVFDIRQIIRLSKCDLYGGDEGTTKDTKGTNRRLNLFAGRANMQDKVRVFRG